LPILPYLKELNDETTFRYLVLVDPEAKDRKLPNYDFIEVMFGRPSMDRIYTYLHSSDVCLIHKRVVSSSVLMCLGDLTPIVTSNTEFVSFLDREAIKYRDATELKRVFAGILKGK